MEPVIFGTFYHHANIDGSPRYCNGCRNGHKHSYSFSHAHLSRNSDGHRYYAACNRNCYPDAATLRVPDARPAADAPGGEHKLADR